MTDAPPHCVSSIDNEIVRLITSQAAQIARFRALNMGQIPIPFRQMDYQVEADKHAANDDISAFITCLLKVECDDLDVGIDKFIEGPFAKPCVFKSR